MRTIKVVCPLMIIAAAAHATPLEFRKRDKDISVYDGYPELQNHKGRVKGCCNTAYHRDHQDYVWVAFRSLLILL